MPQTFLPLVLAVLFCGPASAAITFSLGNTTVVAGSKASISLNASSTSIGGESLGGFNLGVDIGNDGRGVPEGFSNFDVADPDHLFGSESVNQSGIGDADKMVNAAFGDVSLNAIPRPLLYLTLDTAASMTPGIYQISLEQTGLNAAVHPNGDPASIHPASYATFGTITVTAVPEPSSMAVLGVGMGGLWYVRQRRQRRRTAAAAT